MIVRTWITQIDESQAAAYEAFARERSVPMFRSQAGVAGALFGAREGMRIVVTFWDSLKAAAALDSSASYQDTVRAITAAGFLHGESSVETFELEGAALDEGVGSGIPRW